MTMPPMTRRMMMIAIAVTLPGVDFGAILDKFWSGALTL